jgi:tetratricopeptide (TPR) repeat protein
MPGSSRFIFTTRPKLKYDSPYFLQIALRGLNIDEARELFRTRRVEVKDRELEELHSLLQGHPLWIGLIANQILSSRVRVSDLIARIKNGKEADLPNTMLKEIWSGLKPRQQKLLRYLAELVRPETEKQIEEFVHGDFSHDQFRSTLKRLKTRDLVVVKSPHNALDTVELHPLVREFIRQQYSRPDRNRYIATIMVIFDRAISKLRPILSIAANFDTLQNWTGKAELLVNSGDYRGALAVLDEASNVLHSSGFSEDFVRLAYRVLAICDLNDSATVDSTAFENTYEHLIIVLSELGRFEDAEEQLVKFEHTTAGATARYICVCRLRTYFYWSMKQFDLAKEWGQRGVSLKASSNIDTRHSCAHDLALAQRDSGETDSALLQFLEGAELSVVVNPAHIDPTKTGQFYGNIGRTLQLTGKDDDAMTCIIKSAFVLE